MFDAETPFVLLDDRLSQAAGATLYRNPVEIHACHTAEDVMTLAARLERAAGEGLHAAGYLAYEVAYVLEPKLTPRMPCALEGPLSWFGLFEGPCRLDPAEVDQWLGALPPPPPITNLQHGHSRARHMAKVEKIQQLIAAGDLYQANLTFPLRFQYDGPPASLFAALRARQPVAHGALVWTGERWLLSISPELFFAADRGRITTRPMKGTCPRGADAGSDLRAAEALRQDPKQRAENLMIVDLLRNDVSRVARPGSVKTSSLFAVETYPTFHAMTSTVTGELRPQTALDDLLSALFPCGSVVGAPKIRAAEVIADQEDETRGAYCGAIGAISPDGDMTFSVAIRTAVLEPSGSGRYGVGGGIVADSEPSIEYDEALLKARVLTELAEPYQLIETFRWEPETGFLRLDLHLARLSASAVQLGFRNAAADLIPELARAVRGFSAPARIRAVLHRGGHIEIEASPIEPTAARTLDVVVSGDRLDAADPFLRHKTSRRAQHERAFAGAAAAGAHEAVLLNTRGDVADGARSSVFVQAEDRLLTPALVCGALPGVLRAELIATGAATEAVLSPADLASAPFWLGSSLRGLRRATLRPQSAGAFEMRPTREPAREACGHAGHVGVGGSRQTPASGGCGWP